MLPIASNANSPPTTTPTLVATPLPETAALRAPPSAVPPSFSNPVVHNNTRGNGHVVIELPQEAANNTPEFVQGPPQNDLGSEPRVSATFLAQLIGQQPPVATQGALSGVLTGYSETYIRGLVKYKPSFASLPEPQVHTAFTRAVQEQASLAREPVHTEQRPDPDPVCVYRRPNCELV